MKGYDMQGFILDREFKAVAIIDFFESFLWIERYNFFGDFEIYAEILPSLLIYAQRGYYIQIKESDRLMILEDFEIKTDYDIGNKIIITGRSLESMLDRRIIWDQTILSGTFQDGIKQLIDEAIIAPKDPKRKINNFIFKKSDDPEITKLKVDAQFTGTNLYTTIASLCESYEVGFKITKNDNNQFVFELYTGKDRSFAQTVNPYVIFSPEFDNIVNSSYQESDKPMKTVTLVAGEGEGIERRTYSAYSDENASGLDRREMYTDARDISSETYEDGSTEIDFNRDPILLTEDEYNALLELRGLEDLAQNTFIKNFDGQIEQGVRVTYGVDIGMGDIVQVVNEYGMESSSRVLELIRSDDVTGSKVYPTFGALLNREV